MFSCQEDVNDKALSAARRIADFSPQEISKAPLAEQETYARYHLGVLSQSLFGVVNNHDFRRMVHAEVEKETTGETTVLFSTLFKRIKAEKPSLLDDMQQYVTPEEFTKSQQAFWGIDDNILYPQIAIPFYEEIKLKNKSDLDEGSSPIIVTHPIKNQETVKGYIVNDYGQAIGTKEIDEQYAREHEVWVISLNETLSTPQAGMLKDCDQNPFLCYPDDDVSSSKETKSARLADIQETQGTCTADGNPGDPRQTTTGIDVYKDRITVKSHKEPWYDGRSEVWLAFSSVWEGGSDPKAIGVKDKEPYWDPIQTVNDQVYGGNVVSSEIFHASRSDIDNKRVINIYEIEISRWGKDRRKNAAVFTLFEMDPWPAPRINVKVATYARSGYSIFPPSSELGYNEFIFSVQTREGSPYGSGYFTWYQGADNYACGYQLNNSEIELSFLTRKPSTY